VKHLRNALPLITSLILVLVLGVLAAWGHLTTARRVDSAQREDRLVLERTLAGLTDQYLRFALLEIADAGTRYSWGTQPADRADVSALKEVLRDSPFASYGAELVTSSGRVLSVYAPQALPPTGDPGLLPLRTALLKGQPGLSDVMATGGTSVVALGVPVRRPGAALALLVFADVRTWPLQTYDATLHLGSFSDAYVLDARGTVAASSRPASVGHRLAELPAAVTAGGSDVLTARRGGHEQVVSFAPAGQGWTTVQVQGASAFGGGLVSRSRRDALVVVILLTVVSLLLGAFNHGRQRALRRLAEERLYDPLTGLGQRGLFEARLEAALARQSRTLLPLALVYCDLDGFKTVNDAFGHAVGDQLLVTVGQRLREIVRGDDFVARLGGDEFVLVLEGSDVAAVNDVLERLRTVVQRPVVLGGHEILPQVSVGAAVLRDPSRAAELLAKADLAMYDVKRDAKASGLVVLDAPPGPE
jgi:diguanylate cyclase (GGDEF)-like protein